MKNFSYTIALCCFSLFGLQAQQQELTENNWYLTELSIANSTIDIPEEDSDELLEAPSLWFSNDLLFTNVCNTLDSNGDIEYVGDNELIMKDWIQTLLECNEEENNVFEGTYFSFFANHIDTPITYTITNNPEGKTLKLTAENQDYAVYTNQQLVTKNLEKTDIVIHPNPTTEYFTVSGAEKNQLESLRIYNLQGKLVKQFSPNKENTYRISTLTTGVYLVKLENDYGSFTKKLVISN